MKKQNKKKNNKTTKPKTKQKSYMIYIVCIVTELQIDHSIKNSLVDLGDCMEFVFYVCIL